MHTEVHGRCAREVHGRCTRGARRGGALLHGLGVAHVGLYLGDVLDPIRLDAARDVNAPGPHLLGLGLGYGLTLPSNLTLTVTLTVI